MKKLVSFYSCLFLLFSPLGTISCGSESPAVKDDKINENISINLNQKDKLIIDDFSSPNLSQIIANLAFNTSKKEGKIPHSNDFSFSDLTICSVSPSPDGGSLLKQQDEDMEKGYAVLGFLPDNPKFFGYIRINFWINLPPKFNFQINLTTLIDATDVNYSKNVEKLEKEIWSQAIASSQWDLSSQASKKFSAYKFNFDKLKFPVEISQENTPIEYHLKAQYKLNSKSFITITGKIQIYILHLPTIILDPTKTIDLSSIETQYWQTIANNKSFPVEKSDYSLLDDSNGPIYVLRMNSYLRINILYKRNPNTTGSNQFLTITSLVIYKNKQGPLPNPPLEPLYPGMSSSNIDLTVPYILNKDNLPSIEEEKKIIWNDVVAHLSEAEPKKLNMANYYLVTNKGKYEICGTWDDAIKDAEQKLFKPVSDGTTLNYVNVTLLALNKGTSENKNENIYDYKINLCFMNAANNYNLPQLHVNANTYVNGKNVYDDIIQNQLNDFEKKLSLPENIVINKDDIQNFSTTYEETRTKISEDPILMPFVFHLNLNNSVENIQVQTNLILLNKPINTNLSMNLNLHYYEGQESDLNSLTKKLTDEAWRQFTEKLAQSADKQLQILNPSENLWNQENLISRIREFLEKPNNTENDIITSCSYKDQTVYNGIVNMTLNFEPVNSNSKINVTLDSIGTYNLPYYLPIKNDLNENDYSLLLCQEVNKIIKQLKIYLPSAIAKAYQEKTKQTIPNDEYLYNWNVFQENIKQLLIKFISESNKYNITVNLTQSLSDTTVNYNSNITFSFVIETVTDVKEGWQAK